VIILHSSDARAAGRVAIPRDNRQSRSGARRSRGRGTRSGSLGREDHWERTAAPAALAADRLCSAAIAGDRRPALPHSVPAGTDPPYRHLRSKPAQRECAALRPRAKTAAGPACRRCQRGCEQNAVLPDWLSPVTATRSVRSCKSAVKVGSLLRQVILKEGKSSSLVRIRSVDDLQSAHRYRYSRLHRRVVVEQLGAIGLPDLSSIHRTIRPRDIG
jgi:hypothetical protein